MRWLADRQKKTLSHLHHTLARTHSRLLTDRVAADQHDALSQATLNLSGQIVAGKNELVSALGTQVSSLLSCHVIGCDRKPT